jgi:hypothetical protein
MLTRAAFALPSKIRNVFAMEEKASPLGSLTPYSLVYRERTTQRGAELPCADTQDRIEIKGVVTNPITSIRRTNMPLSLPKYDIVISSSPHAENSTPLSCLLHILAPFKEFGLLLYTLD